MLFCFNIELTEKDHYEFCKFINIKSFYGKKGVAFYRILLSVLVALAIVVSFLFAGFTARTITDAMYYCMLLILYQIIIIPFIKFCIKFRLKLTKQTGKLSYSPFAVMEFGENSFIEILTEERTERSYSSIERISIVEEKNIYIHINSMLAYIIPFAAFENSMQKEKFIQFLKTKCRNIDWYKE